MHQALYLDGPKLCSTAGKMHGGSWQGSTGPRVFGGAQLWAWLPSQGHQRCCGQDQEWLHSRGVERGAALARLQRWGRHEHRRSRVGWKSSMSAGKTPGSWLHAQKMTKEGTRKGPTKWPSYIGNLIMAPAWAVVIPCWCKVRVEATVRAESGTKQATRKAHV